MSAMDTPSIRQQRIIVVAFFLIIGAVVWWQSSPDSSHYPVQKFSKTFVPESAAEVDFTMAEAAWSDLQIDRQGNLEVNAQTESALLEAVALMQSRPSELLTARMALLLEKQFGATASQQIVQLLALLKNYKDAEQRFWAEHGDTDPPPHAALFELQDKLLGATLAKQLFSEQRRLADMMLASRRIRNDATLTEAERGRALLDLQEMVQDEGARSE